MRNVGAQTQKKWGPGGPPPEGWGPEEWGPKSGGRRSGGPKSGGPKGFAGPNILRFFSHLPPPIFTLFLSLWGSSRGILVVFLKRWDAQMCTLEEKKKSELLGSPAEGVPGGRGGSRGGGSCTGGGPAEEMKRKLKIDNVQKSKN